MLCIIVTGPKTTQTFPKSYIVSQNIFQKPKRAILLIFTLFLMSVVGAAGFVAKKSDPYIEQDFHFNVYFLLFVLCWVGDFFVFVFF